jgi:hypothetical protein
MDVAKVDHDIAYVAMAIRCSKCIICFFRCCCMCVYLDVAYVSHMLQVFYLDVVYVSAMVSSVFRCFCKCFRYMFEVFHLPLDVCCNCCI